MCTLIVAGEVVFFLPFVLARVFRPTLLDVFQLTNLELGLAFSVYGIVAMSAYFPGGPLADRYSSRKLMAFALAATSVGGLVMFSVPSLAALKLLYGFWGVTTILLFWSPLIRETRHWGGGKLPGRAFGFLDGGRGFVAAAVGSIAAVVFGFMLPVDVESATPEQPVHAFGQIILIFTGITFATSMLVWFGLKEEQEVIDQPRDKFLVTGIARVLRMPTVWLQSIVVVCAYVAYKGLDDISLYANEALGFDEVKAAQIAAVTMWMRPIAAISAGLLADRWGVTRMTMVSFIVLGFGSGVIAAGLLRPGMILAFFVTVLATSAALYALRGLYFAIMDEGRVPFGSTGTAVGIVSVVGYTPDVFMGPLMGVLLDWSPGATGHHHVFAVVSGFAWLGLLATLAFWRITRRRRGVSA